jgi:hypothetical protein
MKYPGQSEKDAFLRACAIAVLIASLILAGRNSSANNEKPPKFPIHSTKNQDLQIGHA